MVQIHPGELVHLRHATSLGELPVTRVEGAVIYVDTGHRLARGEVVAYGYDRTEVIAEQDWQAIAERRRQERERYEARHEARAAR